MSQHRERENNERDVGQDVKDCHGKEVGEPTAAFVAWEGKAVSVLYTVETTAKEANIRSSFGASCHARLNGRHSVSVAITTATNVARIIHHSVRITIRPQERGPTNRV